MSIMAGLNITVGLEVVRDGEIVVEPEPKQAEEQAEEQEEEEDQP